MPTKISLDLEDAVHQWLADVAVQSSITVEDVANQALADAKARSEKLSWQEQDALEFLKQHGKRPGQQVPFRSVQFAGGTKPQKHLIAALNSLEAKGLIVVGPPNNSSALTQAGYDHL